MQEEYGNYVYILGENIYECMSIWEGDVFRGGGGGGTISCSITQINDPDGTKFCFLCSDSKPV